jgi:addiction module RelE/StbE family toxin
MRKPEKREVEWPLAPGFKASWKKYKSQYPEIGEAMTVFDRHKRADPPRQLPGKMKDHKLDGPLSGYMDCHLADDVILIYKPIGRGACKLYRICQHADLRGPKAKTLAKLLKEE